MAIDPHLLLGFLLLSGLLSLVPGPSVVLSTGRAIVEGRRPAMRNVFGNALGGLVLLTVVMAGLGAIVTTVAPLFTAIKIAGAAYLLYLGIRSLLAARTASFPNTANDSAPCPKRKPLRDLRDGFLVGVGNPKSIVSLMAVLPQFVNPSIGSPVFQMALTGLAGGVVQILIETTWVLAANGSRRWFVRNPRRVAAVKATGGVAMIGLSAKLVLERPTS